MRLAPPIANERISDHDDKDGIGERIDGDRGRLCLDGGPPASICGHTGVRRGYLGHRPTHPGGDRPSRIRLSDQSGRPVAWSRDGSKLLIFRPFIKPRGWWADVSLLNANGVVKRVLRMKNLKFASLSPDGLQVVYSTVPLRDGFADVDGGGARLPHRRWYGSEKTTFPTQLFAATFSPDGSQIAYVDGMGDWGNSIRVMDADGSRVRVLVDWRRGGLQKGSMDNHVYRLAWSPDGSRLAFATDDGIWVVGSDGSGLRMVIRHGHNPTWSPDGSHLAYATWKELGSSNGVVRLRIADADGSHVQNFRPHRLGHRRVVVPWPRPMEPVGGC
jgi:WD40 repeat protein